MIFWQHLHKVRFDLFRLCFFCKAQLPGNTLYMGIYYNTWHMVNISPDHVGCFPAYTCQCKKILQFFRHNAPIFFHQPFRTLDNVFGFHMIKSNGMDVLFQFF